jgi:predicted GNAT family acetyltransferase
LKNDGFSEISAVCTHPEYLGRGYARALIFNQIHHIQQQGETAYLHVRSDNIRAIEIYQSMGFEIRSEMTIYVLKK